MNIPENLARHLPRDHLLSDAEWRSLGISMSLGWQHYGYHEYVHFLEIHSMNTNAHCCSSIAQSQLCYCSEDLLGQILQLDWSIRSWQSKLVHNLEKNMV